MSRKTILLPSFYFVHDNKEFQFNSIKFNLVSLIGKELIVCETAKHDFQAIIETIGGPREKERSQELLQRLHIVPDQPSSRTLTLSSSNRIKDRAKVRKMTMVWA